MLETKTVTNGPISKCVQRVCHDTLDFIQVPGYPSAIETRSLPTLTRSYPLFYLLCRLARRSIR